MKSATPYRVVTMPGVRRLTGATLTEHPLRDRTDLIGTVSNLWDFVDDLWRRRAALVCQVGAKSETDPDLPADIIIAPVDERDCFVRKGIGWALRDYARTDPAWVRAC